MHGSAYLKQTEKREDAGEDIALRDGRSHKYREERAGILIVRRGISFRHREENKGTSNDTLQRAFPSFPACVWNTLAQCVYHDDDTRRNQESTNTSTGVAKEPGRHEAPNIRPSWPQQ